jgi:hypothetical protein
MNSNSSITRFFFLFFLFIFLLILFTNSNASQRIGTVQVGSTVILRLVDDGQADPVSRAEVIQQRIDNLFQRQDISPADVRVAKVTGGFAIYCRSILIITVDAHQARANRSMPEDLAKVWAENLRKAIRQNVFNIAPSRIEVPVGGTARVMTTGMVTGDIVLESYEGIGGIEVIHDGNNLILKAPSTPGRSSLILRRGSSRARLFVHVKESAAVIPEKIETVVSGEQVPRQVLIRAAENAVRNNIRPKPGAVMRIGTDIRTQPGLTGLSRGNRTTVAVPVVIEGQDYFSVNTQVSVLINNIGEKIAPIKKLMVSDRPEAFKDDGILFTSTFTRDEPTRLLFYHLNASREARDFWVEVENPTSQPITMRMIEGWAGPDKYGIIAGHQAALRFLDIYNNDVSYNIYIPAKQTMTIFQSRMPSRFVLAGYIHMQIDKGSELKVSVKNSTNKAVNGKNLPVLHQPFDPFRIHPKGVFTPANLHDEIEYKVGQTEETAGFIGRAPWLIDAVTGEPNNGNYGVLYKFNVKLSNPTKRKQRIGFFFVPVGRRAMGTFLVDGQIYETGLIVNPNRKLFLVKDLEPGEKKEIGIISTPEGGSYYPVKVVIEPVGANVVPLKPDEPDPKILPDDEEIDEEI